MKIPIAQAYHHQGQEGAMRRYDKSSHQTQRCAVLEERVANPPKPQNVPQNAGPGTENECFVSQ